MHQQPFASPEEALQHFGIKGMRWGIRKERESGEFSNWGKPYDEATDGLSHGSKELNLKKTQDLRVDHSLGFADIRPVDGYRSANVRRMHDDLVSSLKAMRDEHPNVAEMKVIVAPASSVPGGPGRSTLAAVLHTKPGELYIVYNDKMKDFSPRKQARWEKWVPGMKYPGNTANHEMGHVLAAAGKLTPPGWDLMHAKTFGESLIKAGNWHDANEANHKAAFKRHGISFEEVSKLSPYAATSASEAYAELHGTYRTPQMNRQMSPELRAKAKSLFDEAGGKK